MDDQKTPTAEPVLATAAPPTLTDRLTDMLVNVLVQACGDRNGRLDSYALHAYKDAIELLAELRIVTVEHQAGRRIVARLHGRLGPAEAPSED